jgi:hypothetical protein
MRHSASPNSFRRFPSGSSVPQYLYFSLMMVIHQTLRVTPTMEAALLTMFGAWKKLLDC